MFVKQVEGFIRDFESLTLSGWGVEEEEECKALHFGSGGKNGCCTAPLKVPWGPVD